MFKLSRRLSIIRASLVGCLVVAVLSTAGYFIVNHFGNTNAATANGEIVRVRYDEGDEHIIHYGTGNNGNGSNTRAYEVINHLNSSGKATSSSEYFNALCAQPRQDNPANDTYEAALLTGSSVNPLEEVVKPIKLIMWVWQYGDSNSKSLIFGDIDNDANWGHRDDEASAKANRRLAFTHAVIGHLYRQNEDHTGLSSNEVNQVIGAVNKLRDLINQNGTPWQTANTYNLFRTKATDETSGESDQQDVVWIEPAYGKIIVNKRDSVTGTTPQGDGSFTGITFTLSDGTTTTTKTLTAGTTSVTFSDLNLNKSYTLSENGGTGYKVSPAQGNITATVAGTQITFTNEIKKGNLVVNKKDKDTGGCPVITNGLTLTGITFNLYNKSSNSVYYENGNKPVNGLVASRQLANDNTCSVSFEGLPYGRYELEEVIPESIKGWVRDTTRKPITIHPNSDGETVTYDFENQPIRGDITFTKKDSTNNTPMANAVFEISSISSNYTENHIVVADANGVVDTRSYIDGNPYNLHTNNTNGYDELYYASETPVAYAGYGTWFGFDSNGNAITPRNDVGALPYGTYLIQELKCDTNMFCTSINNEKKTFTITTHNQVVNLNDANSDSWGNDCAEFSLGTIATDSSDGDHYIEVGQETSIKDRVTYCAKKNYTFTIKGILMDKETNQPFLINGETVEQSVEISPTDNDCGEIEMVFPLTNANLVAGKSIVVFEKLYYKDEVKASHEDPNNPDQTIEIVSLGTVAVDNSDNDKLIVPSEETVIKDTVSYCATAGQQYSITGVLVDKTTGQPILVDGQPVTQKVTVTPEENCGTAEMVFPAIDTTAVIGHPVVVYETLYKVKPGEPDTEEPVISHEDPNDEDQTVYVIDISTTVQPTEDGTKVFPLDSDVTVTDMVHYCLQPGLEYTVKGIVMDKSTGNGLLVDGKLVEQSVTFTPTEVCGEFPMHYTFNTKGLTGAQLVIFESLYYNNELLIEHKDIENELESFEIDITPPDTGFITKNASGSQETSHQELLIIAIIAIAPVGIYTFNRRQARKHFLNR